MNKLLAKYLLSSVAWGPEGEGTGAPTPAATSPAPEPISSPSPEPSKPAVEPQTPAGEGAAQGVDSPAGGSDAGGVAADGPVAPLAPAPSSKGKSAKEKSDWRDARIAKLTGQLQELREKVNNPPPVPAGTPTLDPTADFNARVAAAAQQQVAMQSFNDRCNAEAMKGRKQWEDFDARLADVRALVDATNPDEVAAYNAMLSAGLETGELATLVYELGQDLDEASRILSLSPMKMGVELTKKALAGARIEPISGVPKPITPVAGGRGEQVPIDPTNPDQADNLTTAEWMKRREAQVAARGRQ